MGVMLDENVLSEVLPDTPAAKAGLKSGDKIVKVGEDEVTDRRSLIRAMMAGDPKKKVVFERDGKKMEATLEWPAQQRRRPAPAPKEEEKDEGEKKRGDVR